jgi:hypothetical protein
MNKPSPDILALLKEALKDGTESAPSGTVAVPQLAFLLEALDPQNPFTELKKFVADLLTCFQILLLAYPDRKDSNDMFEAVQGRKHSKDKGTNFLFPRFTLTDIAQEGIMTSQLEGKNLLELKKRIWKAILDMLSSGKFIWIPLSTSKALQKYFITRLCKEDPSLLEKISPEGLNNLVKEEKVHDGLYLNLPQSKLCAMIKEINILRMNSVLDKLKSCEQFANANKGLATEAGASQDSEEQRLHTAVERSRKVVEKWQRGEIDFDCEGNCPKDLMALNRLATDVNEWAQSCNRKLLTERQKLIRTKKQKNMKLSLKEKFDLLR